MLCKSCRGISPPSAVQYLSDVTQTSLKCSHLYCRRLQCKSSAQICFKLSCTHIATWLEMKTNGVIALGSFPGAWSINISVWRFYIFAAEGSYPASYTPVLNPTPLLICPYTNPEWVQALHNTHFYQQKHTDKRKKAATTVPQLAQIDYIPQITLVIVFRCRNKKNKAAINQSGGEEEASGCCVQVILHSIYSDKGVFM